MIIALSRFIRGFSLSRRSVSPTPEMPPFSRFCDRRRGNRRGAASFADGKSRARSGPNLPFCPRPSASVHSPVLRSSAFVRPGLVALFVAAAAVGVEFGVVVDASNRVRASSNGQLPECERGRTKADAAAEIPLVRPSARRTQELCCAYVTQFCIDLYS